MIKLKRSPFLPLEGEQPDLYAPVWLSTTLIFLLAVAGNVSAWEHNRGADMTLVMTGVGLVYGYVLTGAALLWGSSKWLGLGIGLVRAFCLYGERKHDARTYP